MKFKFPPHNIERLSDIIGKVAVLRFKNTKGNRENQIWVRDVIDLFANKSDITFAQAVQVIKTDGINAVQKIHRRHGESLPEYVMLPDENGVPQKAKNPLRTKLLGFAEMAPHDHQSMIRTHLSFAASLRHPNDKFGGPKKSEPDPRTQSAMNKKNLKHPDELRSSHRARTIKALAVFLDQQGDNLRAAAE